VSGRSSDHAPPVYRIREAHGCEHPVYASDPSNKESALRRRPKRKGVSTSRRKAGKTGASPWSSSSRRAEGARLQARSLLEDRKQAGRFLTFETWADQAAIKAAGPMARPHPGEAVHAGVPADGLGRIRAVTQG
jgi:hypothetical protein